MQQLRRDKHDEFGLDRIGDRLITIRTQKSGKAVEFFIKNRIHKIIAGGTHQPRSSGDLAVVTTIFLPLSTE